MKGMSPKMSLGAAAKATKMMSMTHLTKASYALES